MRSYAIFIIVCLLTTSCYKEVIEYEVNADQFNLSVPLESEKFINQSRDSSYSIDAEGMQLYFNEQLLLVSEIRVRGKSALNFRRKSFAVFLDEPIYVVDRYENSTKALSRFKLLSLSQDQSYVESRLAFGLLNELALMPLFFKYVELKINENTQGVYFLVEDPEQFYKESGSEFILRRGYNHAVDDSEYAPIHFRHTEEGYINRFREIYQLLPLFTGSGLQKELNDRLDLRMYNRKIGLDYLLQNGDYTDEVYFYAQQDDDSIRFSPLPWDYDDIFDHLPHEVGVDWGMGKVFGERSYNSLQDIIDDIGDKLIFSIEDDLDYTIARDSELYNLYQEDLSFVLSTLSDDVIERVFSEIESELEPFYNSEAVIDQSKYDLNRTDKTQWLDYMKEKKAFLKSRRSSILEKL